MTLPVAARREDTVVRGLFRKWILKHIDSWFAYAEELDLGIAMEDIILVTGCHRTKSWTNVAFNEVQTGAQLSLQVNVADALGANINWGISNVRIQGAVHNQGPSGKVRGMRLQGRTDSIKISSVFTSEPMYIYPRVSCQTLCIRDNSAQSSSGTRARSGQ